MKLEETKRNEGKGKWRSQDKRKQKIEERTRRKTGGKRERKKSTRDGEK